MNNKYWQEKEKENLKGKIYNFKTRKHHRVDRED